MSAATPSTGHAAVTTYAERLRALNDRTDRCKAHSLRCAHDLVEAVLVDVRFGALKLDPETQKLADLYVESRAALYEASDAAVREIGARESVTKEVAPCAPAA